MFFKTLVSTAALTICFASSGFAFEQSIGTFELPIDCQPQKNCWVVNYVDMQNPKDGKNIDPACGARSYDGHKGTDFAIENYGEIKKGVDVLAARAGTVLRTRDGEADIFNPSKQVLQRIKRANKDCGNGVIISHGNNLETNYCHLKKGSIIVKPGQKVVAGQKLGEVGASGNTQFPHLHFGIRYNGQVIDPFTGNASSHSCGLDGSDLWAQPLPYAPVALYDAGFTDVVPDFNDVNLGLHSMTEITPAAKALVFWGAIYGVREDDKIKMKIFDPKGNLFAERIVNQDKNRARQFLLVGKKLTRTKLIDGLYQAELSLTRHSVGGSQPKTWRIKRTIRSVKVAN